MQRGDLPPRKMLRLQLNSKLTSYDNIFLRDACSCSSCVHPSTQQKLFNTADIPYLIYPKRACINDEGNLEIVWSHPLDVNGKAVTVVDPESDDDTGLHRSIYTPQFLQR